MSIKYGLYKTPVPGDREDKGEYHARFLASGRTTFDRLSELIAARTTLSDSEVKGMLKAFVYVFQLDMKVGMRIELEGIGTFYPVLASRMEENEKGEQKLKVEVKTVGFRCAKSLKNKLRYASVSKKKSLKIVRIPPEQRKSNILEYLQRNISITTKEAQDLNHCSKPLALADIHALMEEGKILSVGAKRNTLYIRPYGKSGE